MPVAASGPAVAVMPRIFWGEAVPSPVQRSVLIFSAARLRAWRSFTTNSWLSSVPSPAAASSARPVILKASPYSAQGSVASCSVSVWKVETTWPSSKIWPVSVPNVASNATFFPLPLFLRNRFRVTVDRFVLSASF
jgi:hypothetical protein